MAPRTSKRSPQRLLAIETVDPGDLPETDLAEDTIRRVRPLAYPRNAENDLTTHARQPVEPRKRHLLADSTALPRFHHRKGVQRSRFPALEPCRYRGIEGTIIIQVVDNFCASESDEVLAQVTGQDERFRTLRSPLQVVPVEQAITLGSIEELQTHLQVCPLRIADFLEPRFHVRSCRPRHSAAHLFAMKGSVAPPATTAYSCARGVAVASAGGGSSSSLARRLRAWRSSLPEARVGIAST